MYVVTKKKHVDNEQTGPRTDPHGGTLALMSNRDDDVDKMLSICEMWLPAVKDITGDIEGGLKAGVMHDVSEADDENSWVDWSLGQQGGLYRYWADLV